MTDLNDVFADVKKEGGEAFPDNTEKDTSTESQPENKQEAGKPDQGDNTDDEKLPFHQHPRWIERENELKELREKAAEVEDIKAELLRIKETSISSAPGEKSEIPKWFSTIYGDNPEAWAAFSEYDKSLREEIKRDVLNDQVQKVQQAQKEAQHWDKWVNDEFSKLEAEGLKFDRNELARIIIDYAPTDKNNNYDFRKGFQIYEAIKSKETAPNTSVARKKIADSVTKTSKGESKSKDFLTSNDLRGKSWDSIVSDKI